VCREAKEASEFGFYYGASESEVTEKLGRPSNISIDKDGLRKTLSFSKYRAAFEFGAGQSLELCAMGNGKVQFREEYVHDGSTSGTTK
jgi:hypothetical protein